MSAGEPGLSELADSIAAYESRMRAELGDRFDAEGLERKHKRMREHPFLFLRATCWRWAEAAPLICPELMDAPRAPSVGDAHAGNFGLWRDAGARLVWGVNDFDEAARLPWPLDLVRLGASISLAVPDWKADAIADAILDGYREGAAAPGPWVLERDHLWLRDAFAANDAQREGFWAELQQAEPARVVPPELRDALVAALPEPGLEPVFSKREAGAGSLGRGRFVAWCEHRGGPLAIEVKAMLPSCWQAGREPGLADTMLRGRHRSPDFSCRYGARFVVRRLAPNSRKLTFAEIGRALAGKLVRAMGTDLASIHACEAEAQAAVRADLKHRRGHRWLADAIERVARWTVKEHKAYAAT
ncbi:DUF2252 family protein [Sphingomonas sp.]|uniref:DUF2252 family protein n=1 Tax=Sphingomonas sp. TaxID=28214 RepID=UPI001B233E33|nr:DUF2252 family protein [Sphingomonas sp.]MBO9712240.1 DUF2252 family protein [Sphingomonas sp.]